MKDDFSNSKNTVDPYKISLYSINSLNTIKKDILDSSSNKKFPFNERTNQPSIKKPPLQYTNLNKVFGEEENLKKTLH